MDEELIKTIKKYGYWKVIIRPTTYNSNLLSSLKNCIEIIEKSKVEFRGWDYPHIDINGVTAASDNSVHSFCDWPEGPMYEYWRFYQTGQFFHLFSMREDLRLQGEHIEKLQKNYRTDVEKFLSILSTVYSVTEICEFSRNLAENIGGIDGLEIIIELHGVSRRMLFFWDNFMRYLSKNYICTFTSDVLTVKKVVSKDELISNSKDIALDLAIEIFNKFNWTSVNKSIFIDDQKKLLEGRV